MRGIGTLVRFARLFGQQRFEPRNHRACDSLARRRVRTPEILKRFAEKGQRVHVAAVHLDDRQRGLRSQLRGVPIATEHGDEPGRTLDGPLPLLNVVTIDLTPGQQHADRRPENYDLCRPTHPTCGTIPLGHATRQDNRGFRHAIKNVQDS